MRVPPRLTFWAAAVLVALTALAVLWQRGGDARAGEDALHRAEQATRGARPVTPAELTDEPFDRLVVVPGTAGADDIRRAVGTDWRRADELAYQCCDPAPIWAFVHGDEVVAFFRASSEMSYGDRVPAGSYPPSAPLALAARSPSRE